MQQQSQNLPTEKLHKVLANLGISSRRQAEKLIDAGRVTVNGKIAKLGDRVTQEDKLAVDGRIIKRETTYAAKTRVIIYHKPVGEICTRSDEQNRKTVFENLPKISHGRWISIGRLDINTSGLLLFTNDGELANRLMHPSSQIEREYAVRVLGEVSAEILQRLKQGVKLEDGMANFARIRMVGKQKVNHWYHVVLTEGRNREVRRLWESQGVRVSRLSRIRFANIKLPRNLPRGQWQELNATNVRQLLQQVGLSGQPH